MAPADLGATSPAAAWAEGALIRWGNPKAVVSWGSIFAVGLRPAAPPDAARMIVAVRVTINLAPPMANSLRARRWPGATSAALFAGAAGLVLSRRAG